MSQSQTRSQRRAEMAEARRRGLIKAMQRSFSIPQLEQLAFALLTLGCDEVEIVEAFFMAAVPLDMEQGALYATMSAFVSRILLGRANYCELDIDRDPRDWGREAAEELVDLMVYSTIGAVAARRADPSAPMYTPYLRDALQISTLADDHVLRLRVNRVADTKWCADATGCTGGGLYFGPLSARVENGRYTLHCHQCEASWPAEDVESRPGSEIVIPQHRRVPR